MNYKIESGWGSDFNTVAQKAKEIATARNVVAEFEFNGCVCLVNSETNLDFLYRDYSNHWTMEWETVGPDCVTEYNGDIKSEFERKTKIKEEKAELERIEYKKKEDAKIEKFAEKINGIEVEFSKKEDWELGKSKNTDGYGACIYEYAEGWAKLMQVEMSKGNSLKDIAQKTSFEMDFLGISGFMYGAAVSILSHCWKYGEELWWLKRSLRDIL